MEQMGLEFGKLDVSTLDYLRRRDRDVATVALRGLSGFSVTGATFMRCFHIEVPIGAQTQEETRGRYRCKGNLACQNEQQRGFSERTHLYFQRSRH